MRSCAVVIPTWRNAALVRACLEAMLAAPPAIPHELVVVDDGSGDETLQVLAAFGGRVTIVERKENAGFGHACNDGVRAAQPCDYVAFVNNDTIPVAGWLDALVAQLDVEPVCAIAGARLLYPNGTVQHAGIAIGQDRFPHNLYAGFPGEHPAVTAAKEVQAVTAAAMVVRRPVFEELGGFDTAFHNGYEDVDLCLRARDVGHRIRYCPSSVLYHLESVTRWPTGRPEGTEVSDRLYRERWLERVRPDDLEHYVRDGLLALEYGPHYPVSMRVAPDLAAVDRGQGRHGIEGLLARRSEQVMEMLAEKIRTGIHPMPAAPSHISALTEPEIIARGGTHALGGAGTARHLVSVVMPVKNEAGNLAALLPLLLGQRAPALLEIVAVDSGSTDGTIDVLRDARATILAIPPEAFDHGVTRNLGAAHARGDVLLYVNSRTRPIGTDWLRPLLADLADPLVAGVCSRVIPHTDADVLEVKDGMRELSASPHRMLKRIDNWDEYRAMPVEQRRAFFNFHTASAAIRADVLIGIPFRQVRTIGEDILWAKEVLEQGFALVHEPASLAHHGHAYALVDLLRRNVDDGVANRDINGRTLPAEEVVPLIRGMVADDWAYLAGQIGLTGDELVQWQVEAVLRRTAQVVGQHLGASYAELPAEMIVELSRIHRTRRR